MTPVGEAYRAAGPISIRSVMTTLILGTVTAILCALVIWLWEISPIPTLVILTPLIHGFLIGAAMAFMVGRLRMRNPLLIGTIGLACGLLSVGLVHFGHYYKLVGAVNDEIRKEVASDQTATPEQKKAFLDALDQDPTREADRFFQAKTGHGGFVGSLLFRNEVGVTLRGHTATGFIVWLLWAGEAAFVTFMAISMPMARAKEPFCEDCGLWCPETTSPLIFPGSAADMVVAAVREDSAAGIVEAYTNPPPSDGSIEPPVVKSFRLAKPSTSSVSPFPVNLSTHRCPNCDLVFASVITMVPNGKEMKKVVLLKEIRVSPETGDAIERVPEADVPDAAEVVPEGKTELVDEEGGPSSEN